MAASGAVAGSASTDYVGHACGGPRSIADPEAASDQPLGHLGYMVGREARAGMTLWMDVSTREREQLGHEALQLQQYLRWAASPIIPSLILLLILYGLYGTLLLAILNAALALSAVCAGVAYRLARANRVGAAIFCHAGGLWTLSLAIGLSGFPLSALAATVAIMPLAAAVPYVSRHALLRMSLVGTLVVAVDALFLAVGAPLPPPQVIPERLVLACSVLGIPFIVASCGLSAWHTRVTLSQALLRMQEANRALR